jgi:hypothetical protein
VFRSAVAAAVCQKKSFFLVVEEVAMVVAEEAEETLAQMKAFLVLLSRQFVLPFSALIQSSSVAWIHQSLVFARSRVDLNSLSSGSS